MKRETAEQKRKRLKREFLDYYISERDQASFRLLKGDIEALLRAEREAAFERWRNGGPDGPCDLPLHECGTCQAARAAILGKRKP